MKRATILVFFIVFASTCNAQITDKTLQTDYHQHKGFFLSMSLGPNFASVTSEVKGFYNTKFTGTGAQFDLKIGGAIKENLFLHATITSNSMMGPSITYNGLSQKASDKVSLGEVMVGAGITYYIMPSNIYLTGSLGLGSFSITNEETNSIGSTNKGFSMQLGIGKEWWVSKKWGLGVELTYGKTNLTNSPGSSSIISEQLDSNNLGILFSATFN